MKLNKEKIQKFFKLIKWIMNISQFNTARCKKFPTTVSEQRNVATTLCQAKIDMHECNKIQQLMFIYFFLAKNHDTFF